MATAVTSQFRGKMGPEVAQMVVENPELEEEARKFIAERAMIKFDRQLDAARSQMTRSAE